MEAGVDTKHVLEEFAKLKHDHKNLKDWSHKRVMKLEDEVLYVNGKLDKAMEQLQKQQETVVKPLIAECVKREKEVK